jgi:uncharacterized protein (TIGR02597 family)
VKKILPLIPLLAIFSTSGFALQTNAKSGSTDTAVSCQYQWQGANSTNLITLLCQPPAVASFKVPTLHTTSNTVLTLEGTNGSSNNIVDLMGVPLVENEYAYQGSNQPNTYFIIATGGVHNGGMYKILSNTTNTITIDNRQHPLLPPLCMTTIDVRPFWTLDTIFPANQATNAFVPTTDTNSIVTTLVIGPQYSVGTNVSLAGLPRYFFNSSIGHWVDSTNPSVSAGDTIVWPGQQIYSYNTGTNSYPVNDYFAGTMMNGVITMPLHKTKESIITTSFYLPRSTPYKLSQLGFDVGWLTEFGPMSFFVQSTGKTKAQRGDILNIIDANLNITSSYYKYKDKWYQIGNDKNATNPSFPAGTVYGISKYHEPIGFVGSHCVIRNENNLTDAIYKDQCNNQTKIKMVYYPKKNTNILYTDLKGD